MSDAHTTAAPAGRPTWIDLSTHDIEAAEAFYTQMFGWSFADQGEQFGGYRMIQLGDGFVGGAMSSLQAGGEKTENPQIPTCWSVYLEVADIDAALAKVPAAGGVVHIPVMEVGGAGRMAIVGDPAGAVVGLWQPLDFAGFDLTMQPGTPVWFESMTKDFDAALPFYQEVFGWEPQLMPGDGLRYATNGGGQQAASGICDASSFLPEGVRSYWRVYFLVPDTDQALEKLQQLGGKLVDGPVDSPFGRLATVSDPQGATFQIIQPQG